MDEASVRFSSEPRDASASAAGGTCVGGGGWLIGRDEGVRPGVAFRRITTCDSGGVDRTGWLPLGGATSLSTLPSTAILRFMYLSKMASRRALSSALRRSSSSCLLLQQTTQYTVICSPSHGKLYTRNPCSCNKIMRCSVLLPKPRHSSIVIYIHCIKADVDVKL